MQATVEHVIPGAAKTLTDDHAKIDKLLDDVVAMLEDCETERAQHVFPDLSGALARHIRVEEEVLFPALSRDRSLMTPCLRMRAEHRGIESELAAAGTAIGQGTVGEARNALRRLTRLLAEHNVKEERVLYPRADAALSSAELENVTAQLR
jgi:hemerythrin-like domain-containing protein